MTFDVHQFMSQIPRTAVPRHVAIIMDGNGRWALKRNKPRIFGHKRGAGPVREVVRLSAELGIEALTLYAFSDENWGRPVREVNFLMKLLGSYLRREREDLFRQNIRLRIIGDLSRVPEAVRDELHKSLDLLKCNTGTVLNLAISYGARAELTLAMRRLAERSAKGQLRAEDITAQMISENLYTAGLPDPDLVIRTSGERRLSNFLLWQAAYAELYFTPVLWPDFNADEFGRALLEYASRRRRFGLTDEQILDPHTAISPIHLAGQTLC
jgi:undecaprenyl diphosphate synthase